MHAARWKCRIQKNRQKFAIWAPSHNFVGLYFRNEGTYGQSEKTCYVNVSPTCTHNMVNFGQLAAEIRWRVWGTPANFNWFRVFAALLHGILAVGVSQTLRRWTEGATCIRLGGHHVGHWPTFLVLSVSRLWTIFTCIFYLYSISYLYVFCNSVHMSHWNKRLLAYLLTYLVSSEGRRESTVRRIVSFKLAVKEWESYGWEWWINMMWQA